MQTRRRIDMVWWTCSSCENHALQYDISMETGPATQSLVAEVEPCSTSAFWSRRPPETPCDSTATGRGAVVGRWSLRFWWIGLYTLSKVACGAIFTRHVTYTVFCASNRKSQAAKLLSRLCTWQRRPATAYRLCRFITFFSAMPRRAPLIATASDRWFISFAMLASAMK